MSYRAISPLEEAAHGESDSEDQHLVGESDSEDQHLDGDHFSLEHPDSEMRSQGRHQQVNIETEEEYNGQSSEPSTNEINIENNDSTQIFHARGVAIQGGDSDSNEHIHESAEPLHNLPTMPTPSSHAYLGEASSGTTRPRRDLEAGSTVEIPILSLPGVILFPGESLPLRLYNPAYAQLALSMLEGGCEQGPGGGDAIGAGSRPSVSSGRTHGAGGASSSSSSAHAEGHLGVVNRITWQSGGMIRISSVGTTAEIRSGRSLGGDLNYAESGLGIMAQGRYRFRFVDDLGWRRGVRFWKVMICPDVCPAPLRAPVPRPFHSISGSSSIWTMALPRFAVAFNCPNNLVARAQALLRDEMGSIEDKGYAAGSRTWKRQYGTVLGPKNRREALARAACVRLRKRRIPSTEPRQTNSSNDSSSRRNRQQGAIIVGQEDNLGDVSSEEDKDREEEGENGAEQGPGRRRRPDPTYFSFWLAANLPLDDEARQELLIIDSVVMRLRLEIKHLEESRRRSLQCSVCGVSVADIKDIFTLPGAEGVVGAYVNPQGHVHQVSTLSHPTAEGGESSSSTQPFWSTVRSAKVVADDNDPLLLLTLCPSWGPSSLGPLCPRAVLPPYDFCAKTLTVRDARGVNLEGRAETEHSWFPGYAWTIASCSQCSHHLGWLFTIAPSTPRSQCSRLSRRNTVEDRYGEGSSEIASREGMFRQALGPERFYGLRRSALKYEDGRESDEEDEPKPVPTRNELWR